MLLVTAGILLFASALLATSSASVIATLVGNGTPAYLGDNGPAALSTLNDPADIAVARDGSLFIADAGNSVIRIVLPNGTIRTFAGVGGTPGFSGDGGPASLALLRSPYGVAYDSAATTLYIADLNNQRVRRVLQNGTMVEFAGTGQRAYCGDGGPATAACLTNPLGVACEGAGGKSTHAFA